MSSLSRRSFILLAFVFLFTPVIVFGQNTAGLCQAFINRAFGDLGNNCANLGTGEACYGFGNFGEVTSSFYVDGSANVVQENVFVEPSERISLLEMSELSTLESISTEDFVLGADADDSRWGLAMLEVPANLPDESAVYLLFGGARLENGVFPADAVVLPETKLSVSTNGEIAVFGSPVGLGYPVPDVEVGTASGNLEADAISPDGEWLRVVYSYEREFGQRTTAWVRVADLAEPAGLDTLPEMGPEDYTPMQNFFLSNSFNEPECSELPAGGLLVQGPEETETDFTLNKMPVRLTSSAYFRQTSANRLQVIALKGFTVLFPDTDNEEVIPEGFTRTLCLMDAQNLGIDGVANDFEVALNCPSSETVPLTGANLAALGIFENIPANLLNYEISVPFEICPSGVGNVQCIIVPASPARIEAKCEEGLLPEHVCERFGF